MHELLQIECRNGPLHDRDRWILRLGGRRTFERARACAAIRQITRACMATFDPAAFRNLYANQKEWRAYLRALV